MYVARGDGYYELQSTTCGLWYTAHFASLIYYIKLSTIQWLTERLPFYLMLSFYTVPSLQFVIIISCHTAHSSRSMRWKPLLFPYSYLILCSHYLMAWDLPYYSHTEYHCCYFKVGLTVKTESRHYQSRLVYFSDRHLTVKLNRTYWSSVVSSLYVLIVWS